MSFVTIFYGISFYVATLILFIGLAYRVYEYATIPAPLKIPTPPAPKSKPLVAVRMFREVVFFESLFSATKWTWLFGWLFHFALLLAAFRHLRYFTDPVWTWVSWEIVQAAGHYAGYVMVFGLFGLLARRVFVDRLVTDDGLRTYTGQDETRARAILMETDLANGDHNILRGDPSLTSVFDTYSPANGLIR